MEKKSSLSTILAVEFGKALWEIGTSFLMSTAVVAFKKRMGALQMILHLKLILLQDYTIQRLLARLVQ